MRLIDLEVLAKGIRFMLIHYPRVCPSEDIAPVLALRLGLSDAEEDLFISSVLGGLSEEKSTLYTAPASQRVYWPCVVCEKKFDTQLSLNSHGCEGRPKPKNLTPKVGRDSINLLDLE